MVFLDWVESSSSNNTTASTVTKELFFAKFSSPEDRMSYLYVFTPRNKASQRLSVAMAEWHVVTKSRACKLSRPTASSCRVTLSCRSEAKPWRDEGPQNGPLFSQFFFFRCFDKDFFNSLPDIVFLSHGRHSLIKMNSGAVPSFSLFLVFCHRGVTLTIKPLVVLWDECGNTSLFLFDKRERKERGKETREKVTHTHMNRALFEVFVGLYSWSTSPVLLPHLSWITQLPANSG